jgi:formamidopyrimidine-DNA glycosylase
MPELAEVELARRQWDPGIGRRILAVDSHPRTRIFRDTSAATLASALADRVLAASRTHGKRLLFTFAEPPRPEPSLTVLHCVPPMHVEVHLGMAGRLLLTAPDQPAAKHDHFVLRTATLALVYSDYRQFGRVFLHDGADDPWSSLPPEVLARRFTVNHLAAILARHSRTTLKAVLLRQDAFPGLGNWMADEICWRLAAHPAAPAATIDPATLRRVARQVCRGALRHVADRNGPREGNEGFSPGRYVERVPPRSWLFQHRWKPGGCCPRCRSLLARDTIATRTTAWCPRCQHPAPSRARSQT